MRYDWIIYYGVLGLLCLGLKCGINSIEHITFLAVGSAFGFVLLGVVIFIIVPAFFVLGFGLVGGGWGCVWRLIFNLIKITKIIAGHERLNKDSYEIYVKYSGRDAPSYEDYLKDVIKDTNRSIEYTYEKFKRMDLFVIYDRIRDKISRKKLGFKLQNFNYKINRKK
ncbi:MAG: hypothetical protein LBM19_01200 [Holosporales bacterium]|jgi:hypothetical protein|nr:hypothetical protein [Holosporales bacterium]